MNINKDNSYFNTNTIHELNDSHNLLSITKFKKMDKTEKETSILYVFVSRVMYSAEIGSKVNKVHG